MENFISLIDLPATEPLKGATLAAIQTENLTIAYTVMKPGVVIPIHSHPEEAVDIVLDGLLEMKIGEKTDTLSRGMLSVVPSGIPHTAKAISECSVVTIFYPKRNL